MKGKYATDFMHKFGWFHWQIQPIGKGGAKTGQLMKIVALAQTKPWPGSEGSYFCNTAVFLQKDAAFAIIRFIQNQIKFQETMLFQTSI